MTSLRYTFSWVSTTVLLSCVAPDSAPSEVREAGAPDQFSNGGSSNAVGGMGGDPSAGTGGTQAGGSGEAGADSGTGGGRRKGSDYFCDPESGSPDNPGTRASPWRTLEEVFASKTVFSEGDIIYLRSGNHGSPVIDHPIASGHATVKSEAAQSPVLKSLRFSEKASHWVVDGVLISPQAADGSLTDDPLVVFEAGATENALQNSRMHYAPDELAETWDNADWIQNTGIAVDVFGAENQILDNEIRNTHVGIMVNRTSTAGDGATGSIVRGNSVIHFWEDAYRCRVGDSTFEYNTAVNSYAVVPPGTEADPPHRDMFQAYRGDGSFTPMSNVVLRGNVFVARQGKRYTKVPFQYDGHYTIQGIGAFDGPYNDWVIENNVVMVEVGLAVGLYGINHSRIVNNTVTPGPFGSASEIRIYDQKDGTASDNNIVRNNLARTMNINSATNTQASNNLEVMPADFETYFVDYPAGNVHLKSGSPAINAGTSTDAPRLDADGAVRKSPIDVGAYEFQPL